MNELKEQFLYELPDVLEYIMDECDRFGDEDVSEHTKQFLRLLHSLKGSAQAAEESLCADICHELESHFLDIGPNDQPWSEEQIHLAFSFLNLLKPSTQPESIPDVQHELEALMGKFSKNSVAKTILPDIPSSCLPHSEIINERTWVAIIGIEGLIQKVIYKSFQNIDHEAKSVKTVREFVQYFQEFGPPILVLADHTCFGKDISSNWILKIVKTLKLKHLPIFLVGSIESLDLKQFEQLPNGLLCKNAAFKKDLFELMARLYPKHEADIVDEATLLLVEDNKINQKLGLNVLTKLGYDVSVANDGLEALESVKHKRFDLILMDLEMPNMGGLQAITEIRKLGIQTPTLAMTAHTDPEVMTICRKCGMNAGLSKPLKRDALIEALHHYQCPLPRVATQN